MALVPLEIGSSLLDCGFVVANDEGVGEEGVGGRLFLVEGGVGNWLRDGGFCEQVLWKYSREAQIGGPLQLSVV